MRRTGFRRRIEYPKLLLLKGVKHGVPNFCGRQQPGDAWMADLEKVILDASAMVGYIRPRAKECGSRASPRRLMPSSVSALLPSSQSVARHR